MLAEPGTQSDKHGDWISSPPK